MIQQYKDILDEEAVLDAVTQAEAAILAQAVQEAEEASTGGGPSKELITRENICNVLVMLKEAIPALVGTAEKKGMGPTMVCAFEIFGDYCLPAIDKAQHINDCLRGLQGVPSIKMHWDAILN